MKIRMKQLGAAIMALAMVMSLSVTALADGLPAAQTDAVSTVTTQGALPGDVTDIVLPTAPAVGGLGLFSMIFDTHGMIFETVGDRYKTANDGKGIGTPDDSRFFFKNYTNTAVDKTDVLLAAFGAGDSAIPAGTKVVKFTKAAATGGLTKIYAQVDGDGKLIKWQKDTGSAAADVEATDWGTGGAFEKIASLQKLDPASGYGLDAIDKLNTNNPSLYLYKSEASVTTPAYLAGAVEYTFIADYSATGTDTVYAALNDDGTLLKAFSALTPTELTGASLADYAGVVKATLTASTDTYYRQREVKPLLSLKKTSAPLTVINKSNATIGVSVSAELTNLPGGDGKKTDAGQQTYVYAPVYNATSGKFFDGPESETTTKEITDVPTLYLTLSNGTDTEVMSYDATATKAKVAIGTTLAGKEDFFEKKWNGADEDSGSYEYRLKDDAYAKREADFNSMTFTFEGVIDKDDTAWDTLSTTSAPAVSITWGVETYTDLKAPTIEKPASITSKSASTFTVTNNPDNAVLVSVKQGGTEVAASNYSVSTDSTTGAVTAISFSKGVISGYADLEFKFKDQNKDFRTNTVTIVYST